MEDIKLWSVRDDILFIVAIAMERLHRYVYDDIFWIRLGHIRRHRLNMIEYFLWKVHHIMTGVFPHWRTKFIQGLEKHTSKEYRGRYSRLDDFYPILKRRY